ncbi:hypothetical protein EYF80_017758 [Liparis tanakae]|uniref:Uncharacterized protein n=1 Tax=Liparis tanakae TaxID=230148 RepID=A0A4Z2I2B1_9TELE|nr:hypothetical protein EYF80_017758 [Liparis tanakae]
MHFGRTPGSSTASSANIPTHNHRDGDGGQRGAARGHGDGGSVRAGRAGSRRGVGRRGRGGGRRQRRFPLLLLLLLRMSRQAEFLRHRLVDRLHGRRGAGGGGARRLLPGRSGVRLLRAGARRLTGPGRRSGDQAPPPHAADGPADEPGPAPAVRGVGGVLAEELENSPQRKRRCLKRRRKRSEGSQQLFSHLIGVFCREVLHRRDDALCDQLTVGGRSLLLDQLRFLAADWSKQAAGHKRTR